MFAPPMRRLTRGGPAGTRRRHDRCALTNFSVQILHLIVGDHKVSVGMRAFTAIRMFLACHANREAEGLYDHCGAGGLWGATKAKIAIAESRPALHHLGILITPDAFVAPPERISCRALDLRAAHADVMAARAASMAGGICAHADGGVPRAST